LGANCARYLYGDLGGVQDLAYEGGVLAAPGGGVQIHQVQPGETGPGPGAGDLQRVVQADALFRVEAGDQPNAGSIPEGERGDDDHGVGAWQGITGWGGGEMSRSGGVADY